MNETRCWTKSHFPLLEMMPDAVVVVDPEGTVVYANHMVEHVFGHRPEVVLGRSVEMLVPRELREKHRGLRERYEETRTSTTTVTGKGLRGLHRSGQDFPLDTNLRPIQTDEGPMTVAVVRDVTERRDAERALRRANDRLRRDLDAAGRIQRSLLPGQKCRIPGVDIAWIFEPSDRLGGDSFNVFEIGPGCAGIYLLDVSGHGVVAALQAVALTRVLAATWPKPNAPSPKKLLERLNTEFPVDPETGQYFTFLGGVLDLSAHTMRYASAGQSGPIHVPARGSVPVRLEAAGLPIGMFPEPDYTEFVVDLQPRDRLYLYSDGVTEAMNEHDEEFGVDGMLASLAATRGRPLGETLRVIRDAVYQWRGGQELDDDMTLLAVEIASL